MVQAMDYIKSEHTVRLLTGQSTAQTIENDVCYAIDFAEEWLDDHDGVPPIGDGMSAQRIAFKAMCDFWEITDVKGVIANLRVFWNVL